MKKETNSAKEVLEETFSDIFETFVPMTKYVQKAKQIQFSQAGGIYIEQGHRQVFLN